MSRPFLRYHWEKTLKAGAPCKKCKRGFAEGWEISVLRIEDGQAISHYFICESCSTPPGLRVDVETVK